MMVPRGAASRAHGDAQPALGEDGPVVVEGDVAAFLEGKVLFDGDESLRHLADGDDAGAVGIDLGGDEVLCAVGERDHHDDRGHADDDAEQREDAAHLVGPEGLQGELDAFDQLHESRFPLPRSDCAGSLRKNQ